MTATKLEQIKALVASHGHVSPAFAKKFYAILEGAKPAGEPAMYQIRRKKRFNGQMDEWREATKEHFFELKADLEAGREEPDSWELRRLYPEAALAADPAPAEPAAPVLTDAIEAIITERRASWDGASQRDREIAHLALDDLRSKLKRATTPEPASAPSEGAWSMRPSRTAPKWFTQASSSQRTDEKRLARLKQVLEHDAYVNVESSAYGTGVREAARKYLGILRENT